MADCEWDDPHDGYARFCLTHECWITAPVTVTACPISDLLGKVQRVREVCDRIWDDARYAHKYGFLEVVREVRYALEGDSDE